jgi:hypothetical protein
VDPEAEGEEEVCVSDRTERVARLIAMAEMIRRAEAAGVPTGSNMAKAVLGVAVDYLWRDYVDTAEEVIEACEEDGE